MKCRSFLMAFGFAALAMGATGRDLTMPQFPLPRLVKDGFGDTKEIGFLRLMRDLGNAGVQGLDEVEFFDTGYAVLDSSSLPTLAAWLETVCGSVGLELPMARKGQYDGAVIARLLDIGATLAEVREKGSSLAMPIGVLICTRQHDWGELSGDRRPDAYLLIETERGPLVYDPPTRQVARLSDFPNTGTILKIQF